MALRSTAESLLAGAYDMHVHSGPDVLPRKFDDLVLARRAEERGMGGFVLKSHYVCTADRATLIRTLFPKLKAFGGVALNNSVGGINPIAVDIAGRLGAKVVWLPTVDSANELENVAGQKDETKLPYWMSIAREMRALGISGDWLRVTDERGRVTGALRQCLELIAKHDMILATAHISPQEMAPVVEAARACGVKRIVVTHPEFPTTCLSIEQQRELQKFDVFFERCFTTPYSGKISWEHVMRNIRTIGASTTILATDLGQSHNPHVDEGLAQFIEKVLSAGIGERDVERMVRDNPAQVLGVD
ncbi:MAG TPA: DUF6282 family protein [Candidatus Acidoferrales bacterium]|nr:DUF6282 family protein [Candidatus Acidoferrales bacterium]